MIIYTITERYTQNTAKKPFTSFPSWRCFPCPGPDRDPRPYIGL